LKDYFNFIYMKEQNFIFAYNPKVACTNWKCVLRYINGADNYLNPAIAHNRQESGLDFVSEQESPVNYISDASIPKYTFVRNPFSRVLSAYLNKVEPYTNGTRGENDDNDYFYKVYRQVDLHRESFLPSESKVNFYCFLHWLSNVDDMHTRNEHWLPQVILLRFSEVKYDFIGKFENLATDAPKLLNLIECDLEFPSQEKVNFAPTRATDKLTQYYSAKERQLVKDLYNMDFKGFDYEK
jgi:hypothetical protein